MKNEPVIGIVAGAQAFGVAVVALLAIIFDWDAETTTAVAAVVQTALALVSAFVARSQVTPV